MRRFPNKKFAIWLLLGSLFLALVYFYVAGSGGGGATNDVTGKSAGDVIIATKTDDAKTLEKAAKVQNPDSKTHKNTNGGSHLEEPKVDDGGGEAATNSLGVAPSAAPGGGDGGSGELLLPDSSNDYGGVCLAREAATVDIDTTEQLNNLNMSVIASWVPYKEYWSEGMERRYRSTRKRLWSKKPLQVIIMPHSHNDPGWLKTLEGYYTGDTKDILNNAVDKLTKYRNMTFVWTEMQFLAMWWSEAHAIRRENLKKLIGEGRFEILTGGWVMTDEANVDIYAMVDQLIEGHSWVKQTFGVTPKSSWSVDPFGHGGTFPYVLQASGVDAMVIMRIHYLWKEWFAKSKMGEFMWTQRWSKSKEDAGILCQNFPYDIYSIKGSCGPKQDVCVQYNFASKVGGQQSYNEYAQATRLITASNVAERAELLLDQYGRTGSLHDHNVVLVPLGDDFMYTKPEELDAQYTNYQAIIDYINQRLDQYHAEVRFGTLSDYFKLVRERKGDKGFPTLSGDFFVYSDIFSWGYPAYWSGYYTTRPFMKQLSRDLESNLRAAEILFSLSSAVNWQGSGKSVKEATETYRNRLSVARQHLALFQHHDAITGTCQKHVMYDYGKKLFEGLTRAQQVQRASIEHLMALPKGSLKPDAERQTYVDRPRPLALDVTLGDGYVLAFNPLANDVIEAVTFVIEDSRLAHDLCIAEPISNQYLRYQVNPLSVTSSEGMTSVEIVFMARLPALSLQKFRVVVCSDEKKEQKDMTKNSGKKQQQSSLMSPTQVYCMKNCQPANTQTKWYNVFRIDRLPGRDQTPQLENHRFLLTFDEVTRRLTKVKDKVSGLEHEVEVELAGYATQPHSSGAYLFDVNKFKPSADLVNPETDLEEVVIVSGQVFSELSLHYRSGVAEPLSKIVHKIRLYHDRDSALSRAIYVENFVDLGDASNHQDTDVFMRLKNKAIRNGDEFYTDQNGFQMQRRKLIPEMEIYANIYPITNMAYIQDERARMTLVVDHAAAASSWQQGWLEVIMDRRALHDDSRGMGEGILDNEDTVHKYWLLFEERTAAGNSRKNPSLTLPSKTAQFLSRRLNFPTLKYSGKFGRGENPGSGKEGGGLFRQLLEQPFPCDLHLFNLRATPSDSDFFRPGNSSLLLLHSQSSQADFCESESNSNNNEESLLLECDSGLNSDALLKSRHLFKDLEVSSVQRTTLTGNADLKSSENSQNIFKPDPMKIETFKIELRRP